MKKKIDNRIRTLLESGVTLNQRTMFFVVGNEGRNQVVILHHMLSKVGVGVGLWVHYLTIWSGGQP